MADIKMINNYNIKDETARNEIESLRGQIPDVSNFATKEEIPTNISELNNDMGYADKSNLDAIRAEIPDTSDFVSQKDLNDAIGNINAILDSINGEEI